jgi:hypothetical protein
MNMRKSIREGTMKEKERRRNCKGFAWSPIKRVKEGIEMGGGGE